MRSIRKTRNFRKRNNRKTKRIELKKGGGKLQTIFEEVLKALKAIPCKTKNNSNETNNFCEAFEGSTESVKLFLSINYFIGYLKLFKKSGETINGILVKNFNKAYSELKPPELDKQKYLSCFVKYFLIKYGLNKFSSDMARDCSILKTLKDEYSENKDDKLKLKNFLLSGIRIGKLVVKIVKLFETNKSTLDKHAPILKDRINSLLKMLQNEDTKVGGGKLGAF